MASFAQSSLLPVLFLSHGAGPAAFLTYRGTPFQDLDSTSPSAAFMRGLKGHLGEVDIKSILVISAHWEEREFTVDYQTDGTQLLYDYYGFPEQSYAPYLTYPVPTDVSLAEKVHQLLRSNGIKNTLRAREGGFDHGVFIPLKLAFPEATIPVVQVSLNTNLDIATHIALGEALASLRREGVLIVGSGQITHSDGSKHRLPPGQIDPRCVEFTEWFRDFLESTNAGNYEERKQQLIDAPRLAPHFAVQHPRTEHFIPLAVAFGAARPQPLHLLGREVEVNAEGDAQDARPSRELTIKRIFHHIAMGRMATDAYLFN